MGLCCAKVFGACCLSEKKQVDQVLRNFPNVRVCNAKDGTFGKFIGRCVPAGPTGLFSPISNTPCIYFDILVEREEKYYEKDKDTGVSHENTRWTTILHHKQFTDFFVQDGTAKIFVQASGNVCKVSAQRNKSAGGWQYSTALPPGVNALVHQNQGVFRQALDWIQNNRYRYTERVFGINETVAVAAQIQTNINPYTGEHALLSVPIEQNYLTPESMKESGWDAVDADCWNQLFKTGAKILLSNKPDHMQGVGTIPMVALAPTYTAFNASVGYSFALKPHYDFQIQPIPQYNPQW